MTWKRGNSSLPLEIFLKPQESANARRFSFDVAGTTVEGRSPAPLSKAYTWNLALLI